MRASESAGEILSEHSESKDLLLSRFAGVSESRPSGNRGPRLAPVLRMLG
jgi:hypothetical protein